MNNNYELQLKKALDSKDTMAIVEFGRDINNKISTESRKVIEMIENNSTSNDVVKKIEKIMNKIDTKELEVLTKPQKGIRKFINKVTGMSNNIMKKYTNIGDELNSIYTGVKQWEVQLQNNNGILNAIKQNSEMSIEELDFCIQEATESLSQMKEITNPTPLGLERQSILEQKISDLIMQKEVCNQTISNVEVMRKTNYYIYRKIFSAYDNVLPIIQNQLAVQSLTTQHCQIINDLNFMDEIRDNLIKTTSANLIKTGKQSIEMLDGSINSFKIIKESQEMIKDGMKQIEELERLKMEEMSNQLKQYRGENYEN